MREVRLFKTQAYRTIILYIQTDPNKGYSEGKWVLPSVYAGGKLTVDAASGISADVKTKNGQALQGAITALGVQPGTEWLNGQ